FLRPDMPSRMREGRLDYLTRELRAATRIADTENVSANGYDATTLEMIERCGGGLVLDCGAGRRDVYHHNVVNYEIVAYDTTDVIGVGEALPFLDNSFDAVISIAVLEHVRDPFRCAAEIARILKPGGQFAQCLSCSLCTAILTTTLIRPIKACGASSRTTGKLRAWLCRMLAIPLSPCIGFSIAGRLACR